MFRTFFYTPAVPPTSHLPPLVQAFTGLPPGVGVTPVLGGGVDWLRADLVSSPILPLPSPIMSGKLLALLEVLCFHLYNGDPFIGLFEDQIRCL